jgi:hypothetical protein
VGEADVEVRSEPLSTDGDDADNDYRTARRLVRPVAASRMPSLAHTSDRPLGVTERREFDSLDRPHKRRSNMPSPATAQRRSIREVVRIGQVWQHDGTEFPMHIKQIHRADRLVEAWRDGPEGREKQGITFADLQREYELIDSPGIGAPSTFNSEA